MLPVGTSDSGQARGGRRYPFVIVPLDPPNPPLPDGAMFLESLVFALAPYSVEQVLADFCKDNGLKPDKYVCRAVVFASDMKAGKGWLFARSHGG